MDPGHRRGSLPTGQRAVLAAGWAPSLTAVPLNEIDTHGRAGILYAVPARSDIR